MRHDRAQSKRAGAAQDGVPVGRMFMKAAGRTDAAAMMEAQQPRQHK
jgi:hypothetical protein